MAATFYHQGTWTGLRPWGADKGAWARLTMDADGTYTYRIFSQDNTVVQGTLHGAPAEEVKSIVQYLVASQQMAEA
jgi:hypothetical protein